MGVENTMVSAKEFSLESERNPFRIETSQFGSAKKGQNRNRADDSQSPTHLMDSVLSTGVSANATQRIITGTMISKGIADEEDYSHAEATNMGSMPTASELY